MKYLNEKGLWVERTKFSFSKTKAKEFTQKLNALSRSLKEKGFKPKKKLYPFYALGYMDTLPEKVLKYPAFLQLSEGDPCTIATYDMDQRCNVYLEVSERHQYREMVNMELSEDYAKSKAYRMEILAIDRMIDQE